MGTTTKVQTSVRVLALVLLVNSRVCLGTVADDDETAYEFKNNHPNIVEGDIMVDADHPGGATIALTTAKLWPNGRVPYTVEVGGNLPAKIQAAIQEWESKTCIRFEKRSAGNCGHGCLRFEAGNGCYAGVGMSYRGTSGIGLGQGCSRGNVIHEIGHALGLHHEQARMDRDKYVTVHTNRVLPQYLHAFDKLSNKDIGEYDYGSIMHYPASAFSRNGQDTITKNEAYLRTNPAARNTRMGQRDALSASDIYTVKVMYKCGGTSPVAQPPTTPTTRAPPVARPPSTPSNSQGGCQNTCYGRNCNYWIANTYKCLDLERSKNCDCSGCGDCEAQYHQWKAGQGKTNAPAPRPPTTRPPSTRSPPVASTPRNSQGECKNTCYGKSCNYWVANTYTCVDLERAHKCDCSNCGDCEVPYYRWKARQQTNAPAPRAPSPPASGRCLPTCFGKDCDYWVANTYTCEYLKAGGCDCAGCSKCPS